MQDNRNVTFGPCADAKGTVCIDTKKVYDSCRDRDCFEDTRVFLTSIGEEVLCNATSIRTKCAKILAAYVGVNSVPFNNGFYQVTVRYYIEVECEGCLGVGKSQTFKGVAALEKDVILYGGESNVLTFSSDPEGGYCDLNCVKLNTDPIAIVETVEPIVLGTKVVECTCPPPCGECAEIPMTVQDCVGNLIFNTTGPRLYVSFGIFSVIRLVRDAQLLVQASDYSVPDKECAPATGNDNPCALFRNMPFPISQFKANGECECDKNAPQQGKGGCGCGR